MKNLGGICICFILSLVLLSVGTMMFLYSPMQKRIFCEKSKNQCVLFSKTITAPERADSLVQLSSIKKADIKRHISSSSSDGKISEKTVYKIYFITQDGAIPTFLSFSYEIDAKIAQDDFNKYLLSKNEVFEKGQFQQNSFFGSIAFMLFGLVLFLVLVFSFVKYKRQKKDKKNV